MSGTPDAPAPLSWRIRRRAISPGLKPAVNYSALLRRHRSAVAMIVGGTLLLSVLYTLVEHKVYQSDHP